MRADSKSVLIRCLAPKTASEVLQVLQIKAGGGPLQRSDGFIMLGTDVLQAGEYTYGKQQGDSEQQLFYALSIHCQFIKMYSWLQM